MVAADLWQWRGEEEKAEEDSKVIWGATAGILKEQLSHHKTAGSDIYAPILHRHVGVDVCSFFFFSVSVQAFRSSHNFSALLPSHSRALITLPFFFYRHDLPKKTNKKPPKNSKADNSGKERVNCAFPRQQ